MAPRGASWDRLDGEGDCVGPSLLHRYRGRCRVRTQNTLVGCSCSGTTAGPAAALAMKWSTCRPGRCRARARSLEPRCRLGPLVDHLPGQNPLSRLASGMGAPPDGSDGPDGAV
jgi:hypothetical protein